MFNPKRILLICSCILLLFSINLEAQPAEISGTVTDSVSGQPLLGAHVFLSGTSIGTSTDYAGRYNISQIQPGTHTVVVSIIGYDRLSIKITLRPGESKTINTELTPVVYPLAEVYVGNLDDKWEKHLNRFIDLFIGESERADSVTILNPEVLRFESRWWGKFTAEALAPLQIENRATGYLITYHLDEFRHSGTITRWDGDSFFTTLSPSDSLQKKYWESQRREVFLGSLQHFFLSLLYGDLEKQGFSIYKKSRHHTAYHFTNRRRPADVEKILSKTNNENFYHVRFYGLLEIVYRGAGEEEYFVRWARKRRGPARIQKSQLELNERPITIDPNGKIVEPYGATEMGYMAYTRFAEALPKEYRPAFWKKNNHQDPISSRQQ